MTGNKVLGHDSPELAVVVVGASGHLARTKIYPALFALYCQGFLPRRFHVFGFARSAMESDAFREMLTGNLTCRYAPGESCADRMSEFLARCEYVQGSYDSRDSFLDLHGVMRNHLGHACNILFYLAIPPQVFLPASRALGEAGFIRCGDAEPWSRVVIEKPFGRDRQSSDELTREMSRIFTEQQTYRIDHYLGKEVIQNLLILRFANLVFEPVWNRNYIKGIQITWKENLTIEGRGGYFEEFGIIRDVMQNHLMQILALAAMEPPVRLDSQSIRDEKVKVLRCIEPATEEDVVIGQYEGTHRGGLVVPGYREDPSVAPDSITATYAATALRVRSPRWDGVPFLMRAGKGLDGRMTELRILFKDVPGFMFGKGGPPLQSNQLVIRIQPDESINLVINNKVPGMALAMEPRTLDLQYRSAFSGTLIPDAYESLILDVIEGDKSLFIRNDELEASWDIFTPVLGVLEGRRTRPDPYEFGTAGPVAAAVLAERHGLTWGNGQAADLK